jgi:RHS repeat-associated protein
LYKAWGETRSAGTVGTKYQYTGQYSYTTDFGLHFYRSRWFDSYLNQWAQPDTIIPDLYYPSDWNRYAYARSSPLKYVDPDGHCPAPPEGWGPAICVALFIEPSAVKAGPFTLRGDGRGFSPNSEKAASRGYIWISPDGSKVESTMNPSGYITGPFPGDLVSSGYTILFDPSNDNTWSVTPSGDGSITVEFDLVVSGPLHATGTAPHINGTIIFTPNGSGGFDYTLERDGFPWAEAYYYDGQGGVQTIFQDPAVRGNPHDLFAIEPNQGLASKIVQWRQTIDFGEPVRSR